MVDIKKDLDEYMLLQSDTKKSFKVTIPSLPKTDIRGWLSGNTSTENEDGSWFQETQRDCCPTMVFI